MRKSCHSLPDNGLCPVRPQGDNSYRYAQLLFKERDVVVELFRKLILRPHFCHVGLPTGQIYIYRFETFSNIKRQIFGFNTVDIIRNTRFDRFKAVQHIAFHHYKPGYTVQHDGVAQRDQIDPSATARTTGNRAILFTVITQELTILIKQLGRERTTAHPCTIGLENPKHFTNPVRCYPQACACPGTNGVG